MSKLKIKHRVLLLSVATIVGMLVFAGFLLVEKRQISTEMESLNRLARLGPAISALVHELQRERGTSAGFIASKGQKFAQRLPAQRKLTDEKRTALGTAFDAFDADAYGTRLAAKVGAARKAVAQLDDKRAQVSSLSITVPQMAGYYTPTIARLLGIEEEMAVPSTNSRVNNAITAYTSFLQAKERAGVERAMGSSGFSAGEFKPPIYRKFLQLIAMQNTFLGMFDIYGSGEQKAFYKKTVTGPAVVEVERMRKVAIESVLTGSTEGIEGPYWFDTITKKIDLLKTVEDKIATDLEALTTEILGDAQSLFYMAAALAELLLAASIGLSLYIARDIARPVIAMTGAMGRLAEGDKTTEIPATERKDEVGEMAKAVLVFKDNMIKADEMAAEQEKERVAKERRARQVEELAENFEGTVTGILKTVAAAATELESTAQSMSATAEQTGNQSTTVATAAEQASANVQTVAAAAEELSNSIQEIGRQVAQATEAAKNANDQAQQSNTAVTGYAPEEVIGRNPRILKSGHTSPEEYRDLWACITAGREWRGELHDKKKNGELFWESASISPITDADGKIMNFLAVNEDITERKQIELKLLESRGYLEKKNRKLKETVASLVLAREKAEAANRAKSEFLANMSHELRTPLNAVIGFSEIMESEIHGPVGHPKYREYVETIRKAGLHLLALITDVLDVSRIESGKLELDEAEVPIVRA